MIAERFQLIIDLQQDTSYYLLGICKLLNGNLFDEKN